MKHVRQSRKALRPIWHELNPKPFRMTGNMAFNRAKKKYGTLYIHLENDQFRAFCSAVGFVEVNWALFESQMDRWVQVAYNKVNFRYGGKEAPTSFSRKLEYLRKAFNHLYLQPYRIRAIDMLNEAEELSETRHNLTHGVITSVEPVNFFKFELENRKLLRSGMHRFSEFKFDVREFPKIASKLVNLGAKAVHLTSDLTDKFL